MDYLMKFIKFLLAIYGTYKSAKTALHLAAELFG
jgi:hypothetical protein